MTRGKGARHREARVVSPPMTRVRHVHGGEWGSVVGRGRGPLKGTGFLSSPFWKGTEAVADNIPNTLNAHEPSLKIANLTSFEFHLN